MSLAWGGAATAAAVVLGGAALIAAGLVVRRPPPRRWADILAQPLLALLLYLALFPPSLLQPSARLTVLAPGATPHASRSVGWRQALVALPGAVAPASVDRVPDLDTALRRYPEVRDLRVLGSGLPARDRERIGDRGLHLEAPEPKGFLDLRYPDRVRVGSQWTLAGRVAHPGARLELRDPSGSLADSTVSDGQGRFLLHGLARAPGTALFRLALLDDRPEEADAAAIPVVGLPGQSLAVLLRVGAPDPEFKYWRRWAADAGLHLAVRAGLSEGIALRDGDTDLTAAVLASSDLVVLDERAWATLSAAEKTALNDAVHEGLGLLLRAEGPIPPDVAADWIAWGFGSTAADERTVTLDRLLGLHGRASFTVAPVAFTATDSAPLLTADDDTNLAWWRAVGRGRVGVWTLLDSYRLVLAGDGARFGTLWSTAVGRLARARGSAHPVPQIPAQQWSGERLVLCGLGQAAQVQAPDGASRPLQIDARGCAADWPDAPGWHQLQSDGLTTPFYVRAADDARTLRLALDRDATRALERAAPPDAAPGGQRERVLPRWPWFLAWLMASTLIWWRERSRWSEMQPR